jgi:hypothetical protein
MNDSHTKAREPTLKRKINYPIITASYSFRSSVILPEQRVALTF